MYYIFSKRRAAMSDKNKVTGQENRLETNPENPCRRKTVKNIVAGVGALAAYNMFPTNWSKPLIEQVFLPAHAGTSGTTLNDPCVLTLLSGTTSTPNDIRVDGFVTPPVSGLSVHIVVSPSFPVEAGKTLTGPQTVNTTTNGAGTFSASLTFPGGANGYSAVTTVAGASGTATCSCNVPNGTTTTPAPTTTLAPTTTPMSPA
jgi:hypothetical protein